MCGIMGLFFKNNHILYQRDGGGGGKYSSEVSPFRSAYETSVGDYNLAREESEKRSKPLSDQKFTFKDTNEIEVFSKWVEIEIDKIRKGVQMETAYLAFKEAQKKETPDPKFDADIIKGKLEQVKHIYAFDDANAKLEPVYKELNESVREASRKMNEAKRDNGEKSKEFKEAESEYQTSKHFRVKIECHKALLMEAKAKAVSDITGNKKDKKRYENSHKNVLKLRYEVQTSAQEMYAAQKIAIASAIVDVKSASDRLIPPPMKAVGESVDKATGITALMGKKPPVVSEFQPIPKIADIIAQNQMKLIEAQKAYEESKKEVERLAKEKDGAKDKHKQTQLPADFKAADEAILKYNSANLAAQEAKLKMVQAQSDLNSKGGQTPLEDKVKLEGIKDSLQDKKEKVEKAYKEFDGKSHFLLTSVAIDKQNIKESTPEKPKSFVEKLKGQFANAIKGKGQSK